MAGNEHSSRLISRDRQPPAVRLYHMLIYFHSFEISFLAPLYMLAILPADLIVYAVQSNYTFITKTLAPMDHITFTNFFLLLCTLIVYRIIQ